MCAMEQQGQGAGSGRWVPNSGKATFQAIYGVPWTEMAPRPPQRAQGRAFGRPGSAGAQSGASGQRPMARPIPIRQVIAAPTSPAGGKAMARRRRKQAIRVYRHALWRQISGLLIVLALGIGCFAEGAGLWTACTWVVTAWQWAGL
jgi:hypothetical protein